MEKKLRILAAGDLHGSKNIARKLAKKAKQERADLVILAGDIFGNVKGDESILEPFIKQNQKIAFVHGNWDTDEEIYCLKPHAKNLHNYYLTYNNVGIAGLSGRFEINPKDFIFLKKNFKKMKPRKRIIVSHLHARDTPAEFSGFPGDKILRHAVDKLKPDVLISSHIHEAEGLESKIGKTKVFQVGRTGKIIEL